MTLQVANFQVILYENKNKYVTTMTVVELN